MVYYFYKKTNYYGTEPEQFSKFYLFILFQDKSYVAYISYP